MACANCGADVFEGAQFCASCGTPRAARSAERLVVTLDDDESTTPAPVAAAVTEREIDPFDIEPVVSETFPLSTGAGQQWEPPPSPIPSPSPARVGGKGIGVGPILAAAGGAAVLLGCFVNWVQISGVNAFDVRFAFLFDYTQPVFASTFSNTLLSGATGDGGLTIGLFLALLAVVGGGLAFVPGGVWVTRACGGLICLFAFLFCVQLLRSLGEIPSAFRPDLFGDVLDIGSYLTLIGGLLLAFAPARR